MANDTFKQARQRMVEQQLKSRGITDALVLEAMSAVPRHSFVSIEYQHLAYKDTPLPIGAHQTISQPYIVAYSLEALQLSNPAEARVLEVGTGLGYQAAVLSQIVNQVYTVERVRTLMVQAQQNLLALNYTNIRVSYGDGTLGWPKYAPYDGIVVSAAALEIPTPLLAQLKPQACLVIPIGPMGEQTLMRITREEDTFREEALMPVAFVPLVGSHGPPDKPFSAK